MVLPSVRNGAVQSVKNCETLRLVMVVRSLCIFFKKYVSEKQITL